MVAVSTIAIIATVAAVAAAAVETEQHRYGVRTCTYKHFRHLWMFESIHIFEACAFAYITPFSTVMMKNVNNFFWIIQTLHKGGRQNKTSECMCLNYSDQCK